MATIHETLDTAIAKQIGSYSDAVLLNGNYRWLITSGTPGLSPDGKIANDISGQAASAWQNILTMLGKADMSVNDLVKVTQYLTRKEDIPGYVKVRKSILGDAKPAFMLLVVDQLVWPNILVEIEIIAAKRQVNGNAL